MEQGTNEPMDRPGAFGDAVNGCRGNSKNEGKEKIKWLMFLK